MENKLAILEGLLFVVGDDGITLEQLINILEINREEALKLIEDLRMEYNNENRGLFLSFLGNTFKITTKKEHKYYYSKLLKDERLNTLSNSALETLAIIAYNEPITRIQIDEIRGVQTGYIIRKLIARGLIKEAGKSDLPGRPNLYQTTNEFLDYFGINSVSELPKIEKKEENNDTVDLYNSKYKDEIIE